MSPAHNRILDQPTFDSLVGTAYYRIGPRVRFREKDNPHYRYEYLDDIIRTTFQGFMGRELAAAGHAFDNHEAPMFHDANAAAAAWAVTESFLAEHLDRE